MSLPPVFPLLIALPDSDLLTGWGGLVVGVVSVVLAVLSRRDALHEKRRNQRLTQTLSRTHRPTALGHVMTPEERDVRSVLIAVAASEQPLAAAIRQAQRLGCAAPEVERLALQLRDSGLLVFDSPLGPQSRLSLKK